MDIKGSIVILKEEPLVVIQYLDHDIAVQGATLSEALVRLANTLSAYQQLGENLPDPVPPEYFDALIEHLKNR